MSEPAPAPDDDRDGAALDREEVYDDYLDEFSPEPQDCPAEIDDERDSRGGSR